MAGAPVVFTNGVVLLGGYDLSAYHNEVALQLSAQMLDGTVFGNTSKRNVGGLRDHVAMGKGLWSAAALGPDPALNANLGLSDVLLTLFPSAITDGTTTGYSYLAQVAKYMVGAKVGSLLPFNFTAVAEGAACARCTSLKDFRGTALVATANGTGFQLGAVGATQFLYGGLHIFGAGTGTIDVTIQSNADNTFGSPTTRITFAQQSGANYVWATPVAGAITDTWWRTTWTIAGVGPSFTGLVWMAIQ